MRLPDRLAGLNTFDIVAGGLMVALGAFVLWEAINYNLGTARSMGPGYFPTALGMILVAIGAGIVLVDGRRTDGERTFPQLLPRPLIAISLAIIVFALTIQRFGLVPAVMLAVLISSGAERGRHWPSTVMLAAVLAAGSALIFPVALQLQVAIIKW
jgi:hypothetical protein